MSRRFILRTDNPGDTPKNFPLVIDAVDVGLGNVDNTSDVAKPVSTAQQTALDLKANIANPTFTGTVAGITKFMVGLGNVDNTSDAAKPISAATLTALALKADLANPTFSGTVGGITKSMVGLGNVDNTSDANKPVSTATQAALDVKATESSGAWTPVDVSVGPVTPLVFTSVVGLWKKFTTAADGSMIKVNATFTYPATADGGNTQIGGLPFTVANSEGARSGLLVYTTATAARYFVVEKNTLIGSFFDNAGAPVTNAQMSLAVVKISASYFA